VPARQFDTPVPVAFFMIGSDDESLRWLRKHRDLLLSQGAVGLLVDASNKEDLEVVAETASGLPITPASGEDIAKALGVKHYPFAVSEGRIWQ
jgi:integrating conjugative element protein (TIGR03765 family)